jgi:hypothetical protein
MPKRTRIKEIKNEAADFFSRPFYVVIQIFSPLFFKFTIEISLLVTNKEKHSFLLSGNYEPEGALG